MPNKKKIGDHLKICTWCLPIFSKNYPQTVVQRWIQYRKASLTTEVTPSISGIYLYVSIGLLLCLTFCTWDT